jgi:type III pantothenate kinase
MLLTIDIGNTNLTLGLFQGAETISHWRLATDHDRMPDEYGLQILGLISHSNCSLEELKGIILASVVPPLTSRIIHACRNYLNIDPLILNHSLKTGINILYDDPASVGADRIADAVAVSHLYKGPACIIDFGTATTFNAITKDAEYLGGAISPGVGIALEALFNRTAQLPRIDLKRPPSVIGRNTVHAMQSGIIFGFVCLVEGMVERFRQFLGEDMKVIATGGFAEIIANETKIIDNVDPFLTLEGMRIIWEMNRKNND